MNTYFTIILNENRVWGFFGQVKLKKIKICFSLHI